MTQEPGHVLNVASNKILSIYGYRSKSSESVSVF